MGLIEALTTQLKQEQDFFDPDKDELNVQIILANHAIMILA